MKNKIVKGIFLCCLIGGVAARQTMQWIKARKEMEKPKKKFERIILPKEEITRKIYFKNPKTMRYHKEGCSLVTPEKISSKRLIITNHTEEELQQEGYLPCSRCCKKKTMDEKKD